MKGAGTIALTGLAGLHLSAGLVARVGISITSIFAIILIAGCAGISGSGSLKGTENRPLEPLLGGSSPVLSPALSPSIITSTPQPSQATGSWAGRISLRIEADPVQFFSAGFELTGLPAAGALVLTSPLGTVLGTLRWAPGQALLDRGDGKNPERFDSVAELLRQSTGAELPLEALFAWLGNSANPPSAPGWQADLSRRSEGRITARRSQPLPEADLRIVLDISATPSAP